MPYERLMEAGIPVGFASDVGGGPQICLLHTMADAYKVLQLQGYPLSAKEAFFQVTKGNAQVLQIDSFVGDFTPGKEADFILIDPEKSPEVSRRVARAQTIDERLFALMMLGDARVIAQASTLGQCRISKRSEGT